METTEKEGGIIEKTRDLCQAVVEQADFHSVKEKLDAFMSDELLKFQFQQLNDLGSLLQLKQSNGASIKEEEAAQFESLRETLMGNPVAQGFIEAQGELQKLQEEVLKFLNKTFELGRTPVYEDVHDGSCSDCGCH